MATVPTPTYGEKLLNRLLRDLPKKQFFYHYEPQIVTPDGSSKPDFVIVSALLGVVVLEVKDWVKLQGGNQQTIDTVRSDGKLASYDNPIRTAEGYAYDLKKRFEERAELWEQYKGRTCLKFPWQVMVALPRISQGVVQQFEKKGIWPYHAVIGKELLTSPAHLQQAIHSLPWKYKLEEPMSLDILDIIRELLNPSLVVQNEEGFPVGTLTRVQHGLISEPLYTMLPKQIGLFDDDELSNEAMGIPENTQVRLVRGVAGSGKTLVLLRRVRHVAEQYPDAHSLVLTFNVELAKDLKQRLNLPEDRVEVASFHKVCRAILGNRWHEPIKTRDWLRRHEKELMQQLGLSTEFVASEFSWRKEMNLWDDEPYLEVERKGRGQRLERGKREIINAMFNRYRAYQSEQGDSGFDWDDVATLAYNALQSPAASFSNGNNHHHPMDDSENGAFSPPLHELAKWGGVDDNETEPYHPLLGAYDAIFIDEAQDFAPSWMQVIRALLRQNGNLFICDDPSQSIFNTYTWPQKGLSVVGRSRILRVPFRSTREISQAAHSLIEADETLRQTEDRPEPDFTSYELGSGPLPVLIACKDEDSETAFVNEKIRELLELGIAPGQTAILCHAKWHTNHWHSWQRQGIYVQYFEKIKGLEFVAVFLPHLQDVSPQPDDPDSVTTIRRKIFTAMTRARWKLVMSYEGTLPKPLEPLVDNAWCENYEAAKT